MEIEIFKEVVTYEKNQIWIKPFCDFFNINYENQTRVIKSDAILANQSTKMSNSLVFGDNYRRVLLSKKGFVRWIQILNVNLVKPELREKFLSFQELIFDFIYGNIEEKEVTALKQQRLAKLKKLESKIKYEIKLCQSDISLYMTKEFQYTLGI
jgi:isopropylmalate/homocitrate/citramalate synthase